MEISGRSIIKSYTDKGRAQRLEGTYTLLKEKQVPHIISLPYEYEYDSSSRGGLQNRHNVRRGRWWASVCVLEALVVSGILTARVIY